MAIKTLKLFAIAFLLNFIENVILLFFFGVELGRHLIIGSGIFALVLVLLSRELVFKKSESKEG